MERKTFGYWTKEKVFEEARKYHTKYEFNKGCSGAYDVAWKNNWLKEMIWFTRPTAHNKKWTREKVFAEARKYNTRKEFSKGCGSGYKLACENGWLDKMDWLVDGRVKMLTDKNDSVYKYYFEETNSIYIGRTIDVERRDKEHLFNKADAVFIHSKENNIAVPPMEIIEDNLTLEEGQEREGYWVEYYKQRGYNILNRAKAGGIGAIGYGRWDRKTIFEKAKTCKTKMEFRKKFKGAYEISRKNKWLEKMPWLVSPIKPIGYWNIKENVFEEAKKYQTKNKFKKGCQTAYNAAHRNGWLDELFPKKCAA